MTKATVRVLEVMADGGERYGGEILRAARVKSGVGYPILARMERDGWAKSRWEDTDQLTLTNRPPRHYYQLTDTGAAHAARQLATRKGTSMPAPQLPDPEVGAMLDRLSQQVSPSRAQRSAAEGAAEAMMAAAHRVRYRCGEYVMVRAELLAELLNAHAQEAMEVGPDRHVETLARSLLRGQS
jgi:PadR family transcriptional regulator PadR